MKRFRTSITIAYSLITMLVLLMSFTAFTYAWFSSNRIVSTNRASGRTGDENVRLLISSNGGEGFQGSQESTILQINRMDSDQLMPVTTADFKTFLYCPVTIDDKAQHFVPDEDEKYYYHGRVYLQAVTTGNLNGRLALYLDEHSDAGGALVKTDDAYVLNAGRLGLTFDGDNEVIFKLSDQENPVEDQTLNTVIDNELLGRDQVLTTQSGDVKAVQDPAVPLAMHMISEDASQESTQGSPLLYMTLNQIYAVDIYFYIEGCDPDCSKSIQYDHLDLHLAFYGILTEEAS